MEEAKNEEAKKDRQRYTGEWEKHYLNTHRTNPQIEPPAFHDENGCGDVYDLKHSVHIVPTTICAKDGKKAASVVYNDKLKDLAADKFTPLDQ